MQRRGLRLRRARARARRAPAAPQRRRRRRVPVRRRGGRRRGRQDPPARGDREARPTPARSASSTAASSSRTARSPTRASARPSRNTSARRRPQRFLRARRFLGPRAGPRLALPVLTEIGDIRSAGSGDSGSPRARRSARSRTGPNLRAARPHLHPARGGQAARAPARRPARRRRLDRGAPVHRPAPRARPRRSSSAATADRGRQAPPAHADARRLRRRPALRPIASGRSRPPSTDRSSRPWSGGPSSPTELGRKALRRDRGQPVLHQGARALAHRLGRHRRGRTGALDALGRDGHLLRRAARDRSSRRSKSGSSGCPEDLRDILSVAAVLGRSFEFRDLEALAEGKREGRGRRRPAGPRRASSKRSASRAGTGWLSRAGSCATSSTPALSRRRRRSLHRRYAEQLEKRHAGRLERVYPQLVHHFSQGDVPEKAVEYGLQVARKSLDAFSAEEAIRAAKTALEFLRTRSGRRPRARGRGAAALARAPTGSTGNVDAALREAERAVKIFERERQPEQRASPAILFAAETAWRAAGSRRRGGWVERGIDAAPAPAPKTSSAKLLSLGGDGRQPARRVRRRPRTCARPRRSRRARRRGGESRAAGASSSRWPPRSPPTSRSDPDHRRGARSSRTSSRRSSRPTRREPRPASRREAGKSSRTGGRSVHAPAERPFSRTAAADRPDVKRVVRAVDPASRDHAAPRSPRSRGVDGVPRRQRRLASRASGRSDDGARDPARASRCRSTRRS